jgi:hypothetical protein
MDVINNIVLDRLYNSCCYEVNRESYIKFSNYLDNNKSIQSENEHINNCIAIYNYIIHNKPLPINFDIDNLHIYGELIIFFEPDIRAKNKLLEISNFDCALLTLCIEKLINDDICIQYIIKSCSTHQIHYVADHYNSLTDINMKVLKLYNKYCDIKSDYIIDQLNLKYATRVFLHNETHLTNEICKIVSEYLYG